MVEDTIKQDFFKDLEAVGPIDILGSETSKEDALKFFAKLMTIFTYYEPMEFNEEEEEKFVELLKDLGCPELKTLDYIRERRPEFFSESRAFGDVVREGDYLAGPMSITGNLIYDPNFAMEYAFGKDQDGYSEEWLNAFLEVHPNEKEIRRFIGQKIFDADKYRILKGLEELDRREAETAAERKRLMEEQNNNIEQ